jgi:hypothetical protein
MSSCEFNLKGDFNIVLQFIQQHPFVLLTFLGLQWGSNYALDKISRPSLTTMQRITLTLISTILVIFGNYYIQSKT